MAFTKTKLKIKNRNIIKLHMTHHMIYYMSQLLQNCRNRDPYCQKQSVSLSQRTHNVLESGSAILLNDIHNSYPAAGKNSTEKWCHLQRLVVGILLLILCIKAYLFYNSMLWFIDLLLKAFKVYKHRKLLMKVMS